MLHQITRDHSLVAKMVEQGRITEEEAEVHPHSNILLRTVGTDYDVDIDIFNVELEQETGCCCVPTDCGARSKTPRSSRS